MAITIEMPRLSDSMHEGIVLRWVKKIGDFVEVGDHLADIETDKAHVELQACEDGTLMEILVPEGGSRRGGRSHCAASVGIRRRLLRLPSVPARQMQPAGRQAGRGSRAERRNPARHRTTRQDHGRGRARLHTPADGPARRVQTPLAPWDTRHATRVDNFYLYSLEANMAYLAAISTPIAVQCEKLIGGRYSLF